MQTTKIGGPIPLPLGSIFTAARFIGAVGAVLLLIWGVSSSLTVHTSIGLESNQSEDEKASQTAAFLKISSTPPLSGTASYQLAAVRSGQVAVPRQIIDRLPNRLYETEDTQARKQIFLEALLPLVLMVNEEIAHTRTHALSLAQRQQVGESLPEKDQLFLDQIFDHYGVENGDWEEFRRRVDIIPPSLALAQGAIESAWGRSRFARTGNALFGQWTWRKPGIVPEDREEGKTHKIRSFDTPLDAVKSYIHNLNTHWAYEKFRADRAELRTQGQKLHAASLLPGLSRYSEKRETYLELIRSVIRANQLEELDQAILVAAPLV